MPVPHTAFAPEATTNRALRVFLHGLPGVDEVGARSRAQDLSTRSIKTTAKREAIDLAIRMVDLTTLEGADTPGKVRALCAKAALPDPTDRTVPQVGAVCVYPDRVATAVEALRGIGATTGTATATTGTNTTNSTATTGTTSTGTNTTTTSTATRTGIGVASVATAFPAGRAPLEVKLADTRRAVEDGATEIDMVIDRGAFLSGDYLKVYDEIVAVKEACGTAHLKVILETGELVTYDNVRRASHLAIRAGADFIKTSTGKVSPAATPPVVLVMLEAVRDHHAATGTRVGVKPAGGIRTAKDAIRQLVMVNEVAGPDWLTPDLFRIGASSLLNDLLMQRTRLSTGTYPGPDYYTLD
ncbi:deoxyribose-phosphate aldolase [Nocardiopsis sp. NPDC049922]|uniref:deoxyribose-phosphate aldolase n=1 Tax=Nocardiopsis sp. NPDC049922 TaxID=3155157 RepID=UPI003401744F